MLEFEEKTHTYRLDGVKIPSVSDITECLAAITYREVPPEIMAYAAERGTIIHRAAEELDMKGEVSVTGEYAPYVEAYANFLRDKEPIWDMIEEPVNNGTLYAGTPDRYGLMDGKHVIVDIKTAAQISRVKKALYTAAQNLYRAALETWLPVDELWLLQLSKDGAYKLIPLPKDDTLATACLVIYNQTRRKEKKHG